MAQKVDDEKDELIANWANPFVSYHQWLRLAEETSASIKRYGKSLAKSGNVFAEQLFGGYLALFSNHCLEQYGTHRVKSKRFAQVIAFFYLPEPAA